MNGDGVDDLIIGASGADPNGDSAAGESYVVFGVNGFVWTPLAGGSFATASNWLGGNTPTTTGGTVIVRPDFGQTITGPSGLVIADRFTLGAGVGTANFAMNGGILHVNETATIQDGGRLSGTGILFVPGTLTNNGEIDLGTSIELSGLGIGEFDRLVVSGLTTLGGTLDVQLLDGFTLGIGQEFEISETSTLGGMFDGLGEGDVVGDFGGTDLFIIYEAGDGNDVALFTTGIPGDFDNDLDVDGADFLAWQRGDSPDALSSGDLDVWETNFGTVPNAFVETATTIPEPTSAALLLLALAGWSAVADVVRL